MKAYFVSIDVKNIDGSTVAAGTKTPSGISNAVRRRV